MRTDKTNLLVCDGNSLAYRSYFALQRSGLSGPWVTHGVIQMLATAWDEHGPFDAILVMFDTPGNLRKERFPEYKANREEREPELYEQLATLHALLEQAGVPTATAPGWEADDLIATAAVNADADTHTWVLTSDRDLLACVSDDTTVIRIAGSIRDATAYTPQEVVDHYGITPSQYRDFAALRGDPSDGLEGVRGVGEKTAAKLLNEFGSGAALYERIGEVAGKLADKLAAGEANFRRNADLMTFNLELDLDMPGALEAGVDIERISEVLEAVDLHQAAGRFRKLLTISRPPEAAPLPDAPPPNVADGAVFASHDMFDDAAGGDDRDRPSPADAPDRGETHQTVLF